MQETPGNPGKSKTTGNPGKKGRPATRNSLKEHCRKAFASKLQERDGDRCWSCRFKRVPKINKADQTCHIFSRGHLRTLYDFDNAYWGCSECNCNLYGKDAEFTSRLKSAWEARIGSERWQNLYRNYHTPMRDADKAYYAFEFERIQNTDIRLGSF